MKYDLTLTEISILLTALRERKKGIESVLEDLNTDYARENNATFIEQLKEKLVLVNGMIHNFGGDE